MRRPAARWLPFLVLLIGTLLRFHALDRQSLWDDELSTLQTIQLPAADIPHRLETRETHPPLYFLQLKIWKAAAGDSLAALRANSALWGVLSLLLLYVLVRKYRDGATALLATAIMALSPFHLAYSQELRPYAMTLALGILGWLMVKALLSFPRKRESILTSTWVPAFAGTTVIWTALLYTHYWGAFLVAAQVVYGLMRAPRKEREKILLAACVAGLAFCAWLPVLRRQLIVLHDLVFWAAPPSGVNLAKTLVAFSGVYFHFAAWEFVWSAPGWLLPMISALYLALLWNGWRTGPLSARAWLAIGVGVPWMLSFTLPTIYLWYRYPAVVYPAFAVLVAIGALAVRRPRVRAAFITALLVAAAWGDWTYFTRFEKANPKAVVAYVNALKTAQSVVVRPAYFAGLYDAYDPPVANRVPVLDQDKLDSPEARRVLRGKDVLFVAFDVPSDPVGEELLKAANIRSARTFPGYARLGVTVYQLRY